MADFDDFVRYEPETGLLYWKIARGRAIKPGQLVKGSVGPDGYTRVCVAGVILLAHRLAWRLATGAMPDAQIDHVNGDKSDNRLSNLRQATASQNQWNKPKQANNVTGYKGVSLHKHSNLYRARLKVDRKEVVVGYFKTPALANAALQAARALKHGEFARC